MKIAIISDVHSNLAALETVLKTLPPVDALWCLGDIVGYASEPEKCVETLKALPYPLIKVAGNHDLGAAGALPLDNFNVEGKEAILWTRRRLSFEQKSFLAAKSLIKTNNKQITLVHGSPNDPIWEYITSCRIVEQCLASLKTPLCFFGHTHKPAIYTKQSGQPCVRLRPPVDISISLADLSGTILINPGSVGQPRDRDARAAFLIFDPDKMTVTFHRTKYPFNITQQKIRKTDLPPILADRLTYGM